MNEVDTIASREPGALQIFHLVFLLLVCVIGTIGNVMTILAVKIERKLRESLSNIFVINLAIADLIVCGSVVPMLIAHDAKAENLFEPIHCYISVVISGVACHTAAATMTCIAVTRYVAASNSRMFHQIITKRRVILAVVGVWLFSVINTAPILAAWITVGYNSSKYVCVCFDGTFPLYYTLGPVFIGHFFPHAITIYCYFCIMRAIRKSRNRCSSSSAATNDTISTAAGTNNKRKTTVITDSESEPGQTKNVLSVKNWSKHEMQLLKTSIWIIAFFSFCWIPYGILVLLQDYAPIELKKTFASLCLLSFSLNPMIYGLLSKAFRRAYLRIIRVVLCDYCGRKDIAYSYSPKTSNASQSHTRESKVYPEDRNQIQELKQFGRGKM